MTPFLADYKTVSFGGLGDAFIVGAKLDQMHIGRLPTGNEQRTNHLFVESNPKTCELIKEYIDYFWNSKNFVFDVECDPDYEINFHKGKWSDRRPLDTSIRGNYTFPKPNGDGIAVHETFANIIAPPKEKKYDVCIQVAGGVHSTRSWKFDPRTLKKLLESKDYKVALVGTAKEFDNDEFGNHVCKTTLGGTIDIVRSSEIYCGVSGFFTFASLAYGIKNIHLENDAFREKYIHDSWLPRQYSVRIGSLAEVLAGLRYWGLKV